MMEVTKTVPMGWTRPDEVMKLAKARKQALQARFKNPMSPSKHFVERDTSELSSLQRSLSFPSKNPFRRSSPAKKRLKSDSPNFDTEPEETLLVFPSLVNPCPSEVSEKSLTTFSQAFTPLSTPKNRKPSYKEPPVDWSLKTKLRIASEKPFPFRSTLKTSEEASGVTGFVRCLDPTREEDSHTLDTSTNAQFHQCCLYWQHPHLPWLNLFPRHGNPRNSSQSSIFTDPVCQQRLQEDWWESFRSLFQLVRARQCPYFYFCAQQFTVLFRAAGIAATEEIHAFITPTTRGFRELLKNEDINFTMPLKAKQETPNDTNVPSQKTKDAMILDEENDSEDEWLKDMGLRTSDLTVANTLRAKVEAERIQDEDSLAQSLVYIEGIETQALYDFLLNSKTCFSTTGALANVPPTLLSPVAFHGATLRSLKVRHGVAKSESANMHSIELQGPVMPHVLHLLNELLVKSSPSNFVFTSQTLENTSSLAEVRYSFLTENRDGSPLSPGPVLYVFLSTQFVTQRSVTLCKLYKAVLISLRSSRDSALRYNAAQNSCQQ
nr:EOG090X09DI [Triops cancriformis]